MHHRKVKDLRREYADIVYEVLTLGDKTAPRGIPTHEILNYVMTFDDARNCTFPSGIGRLVSPRVLAAEGMQWLGGVSDLAQLESVSAKFLEYSDDGTRLYGAYGPRSHKGLWRAIRLLYNDPDTRQAVVSIWSHDELHSTRDLPCTVSWSFIIRRGRLHMTTFMRSNDVWTGLAYDVPIMARIQTAMAWALGVDVGSYTHHAQSMHIYESDLAGLDSLQSVILEVDEPPFFDDIGNVHHLPSQRWKYVVEWAIDAAQGASHLPPAFDWYSRQLAATEHHPYFCDRCRYYTPAVCECE
jgi:thymidylate synthase